jgi:oxalate decarboxylase/phosphoglucose isomerase-like protein (cupin superfamily)
MKHYNIYNNTEEGLGQNTDPRGTITDAFYKCNMNHCAIITNEPGAVRGNHYHKYTTQYTLVLTGSMTYYSKAVEPSDSPVESILAVPGDMIISDANEIHTMQASSEGCTFIAFAEGVRGGKDYESDSFKVDSIIPGDTK